MLEKAHIRTAFAFGWLVLAAAGVSRADWIAGLNLEQSINGGSPTNPNGVWTYGTESSLGMNFTTANYSFTSALAGDPRLQGWYDAANGNVPDATVNVSNLPISPTFGPSDSPAIQPGQMFVHPGNGSQVGAGNVGDADGVIRWTAPATGLYNVSAQWQVINTAAAGIQAAVLLDSNSVTPLKNSTNVTGATSYSNVAPLSLVAGDTLDFIIGPNTGGDNSSDHTEFDATISVAPEPASCLLMGIGATVLIARPRSGPGRLIT